MRRSGPSLFLLLDGNSVHDSPHPTLPVPLDLPKSMVLRKIVPDTTLPAICVALQHKERISTLYGAIYLWQGHLTCWRVAESFVNKGDVVCLRLRQLLWSKIRFVESR